MPMPAVVSPPNTQIFPNKCFSFSYKCFSYKCFSYKCFSYKCFPYKCFSYKCFPYKCLPYKYFLLHKVWVRDLTEEGIEPHPGPPKARVLSKNINGLSDRYEDALYLISQEHKRHPILAVFLQEHHLTREAYESKQVFAVAKRLGLLYIQAHMPSSDQKGGTAIIIPHDSLQPRKDEGRDHAIQRTIDAAYRSPDGRLVTADLDYNGAVLRLASAYAPVHGDRGAFFNSIASRLNRNTILGIDANCVPDTTLDLLREASSPFDNAGSDSLVQIVTALDLTDSARDYLGQAKYFTNHTRVRIGPPEVITKTRIDQVYTPNLDGVSFQFRPSNVDFLSFGRTFEHTMVQTEISPMQQARGRDLQTVNEAVYDDPQFLDKLVATIAQEEANRIANNGTWSDMWESIKLRVRDASLLRSKELRHAKNEKITALQNELKYLEADINAGNAYASDYTRRDDLRERLRAEGRAQRSLYDSLEADAYNIGQRHDVSTAAFHRKWTPKNSAQWIDGLILRDWTDPSNPMPLDPAVEPRGTEDKAENIAAAATRYYKPLFAKKSTSSICEEKCLATLDAGNRVLPPTAQKCSAPISEEELLNTCNHLPVGKSPGPDRIPNKGSRR